MTSVERVLSYTKLDQESNSPSQVDIPETWPSGGEISLTNVSMKYSKDGEEVLKDVTFQVDGGEKVITSFHPRLMWTADSSVVWFVSLVGNLYSNSSFTNVLCINNHNAMGA